MTRRKRPLSERQAAALAAGRDRCAELRRIGKEAEASSSPPPPPAPPAEPPAPRPPRAEPFAYPEAEGEGARKPPASSRRRRPAAPPPAPAADPPPPTPDPAADRPGVLGSFLEGLRA